MLFYWILGVVQQYGRLKQHLLLIGTLGILRSKCPAQGEEHGKDGECMEQRVSKLCIENISTVTYSELKPLTKS